jgi:hypothetical protein
VVRQGLVALLDRRAGFQVVAEAGRWLFKTAAGKIVGFRHLAAEQRAPMVEGLG